LTSADDVDLQGLAPGPGTAALIVSRHALIERATPSVKELVGRSAEELLGTDAFSFMHPADITVTVLMMSGVLETPGSSCRLRLRARNGSGEWAWLSAEVTNHLDDPAIQGVLVQLSPSASGVEPLPSEVTGGVAETSSDNPLAKIFQTTQDIITISGADLQLTYVSPSTRDVLGWEPEVLAERYAELVHPDDIGSTIEFATRLARATDAQPVRSEGRMLHADGSWRLIEAWAVNLLADPDYRGCYTVLRDITDRPTEALAKSPHDLRFQAAVNMASDPVVVVDVEGRIVYVTPATGDLLGARPESLVGGMAADLALPKDIDRLSEWFFGSLRDEGKSEAIRFQLSLDADNPRWVEARLLNLLEGDVQAILVMLREITDQVVAEEALLASEARWKTLVQNAPDCVLLFDEQRRCSFASPALKGALGVEPDDCLGLDITTSIHRDDVEALLEAWDAARADPTESVRLQLRICDASHEWNWFEATLQDHLAVPEVHGVVVNFRNITDRVIAQQALSASERRFRALVQHSFEVTTVVDEDLTLLWVSPSVTELLEWDADELVGVHALDFVHADDHAMALDHLARVLTGLAARPATTVRVRIKSGGWRNVDVSASDRLNDPDVGGFIFNLRDAEERVAAEHALQASERRYRALVQNSTDVVQVIGLDGKVTWVSPAVERLQGYLPDDLLAIEGTGEAEEHGELATAFRSVLGKPGSSSRCVTRLTHRDGSTRWIDAVLVNHLDEPGIAGVVATYRDITDRVGIEEARRVSEERFRSLAESSPSGIFQLDLDGSCTYVNDRWCEITSGTPEQALGEAWRSIFVPGQPSLADIVPDTVPEGPDGTLQSVTSTRTQIRRADGVTRWVDIRTATLTDDKGLPVGTVGTIDDVTEHVEVLREAERLTTILEATPDLVGISNRDRSLVYLNEAGRAFFGMTPDSDLSGLDLLAWFPPATLERWKNEINPSLASRNIWQGEVGILGGDGREIDVSAVLVAHRSADGTMELVSGTARDISDRKALEARLEHEATHDPLTGLPNRTLLLDRLEMAMGRAHRQHRPLAVLFLDLDHFKVVNDSLGHSTGDQLLTAIAARLTDRLRPGDTVARFGGDEFVIICEELTGPEEAEEIASRIAASVAESLWIGDSEVYVTASVGIALASELHHTPEQVLRDADAAMYQAKARGRSRHEVFDSRLRTRALDRLEVESALRRALVRHELRVHYQPVFDLATGGVTGVEALLRWEHPQRGLLLPAEFLRVAEESGLVVPVGSWVMRQACRQIQRLRVEVPGYDKLQVAVNLSARQIGHPYLVDELAKVLADTNVGPDTLVLEITESVLMDDVPANGETLRRLKDLGVRLAIDDFGTGYSSLAYLRRFPVDVLKVDRSFVSGLGVDPEDAAITNAVITLSHTLGLVAIAEGVESPLQRDELIRLGCDQAQGFLLGRPMNPADLADFLIRQGPPPIG